MPLNSVSVLRGGLTSSHTSYPLQPSSFALQYAALNIQYSCNKNQHLPVVPDEIVEGHAPVVLNLRVVEVGVEHDRAKGHGERRVGVDEGMPARRLPLQVLLSRKRLHETVDALGLKLAWYQKQDEERRQ